MTRENKLALVIGFGLILFVGILISDHFSTAERQHSSQLGRGGSTEPVALSDEPLLLQQREDRDASRRRLNGEPATHVGTIRPDDDERHPVEPIRVDEDVVRAPDLQQPVRSSGHDSTESARQSPMTVEVITHHVDKGESLSTICQQYYGTSSLVAQLAAFNNIENPDRVNVGRALRIPRNAADLTIGHRGATGNQQAVRNDGGGAMERTYTMAEGDTLSRIAARFLGSAGRWRDLYELNRDVIDDPDAVPAGTTIRLPASAG